MADSESSAAGITSRTIRVAVVEDRDEIRDGLVALFAHSDGFVPAGAWGSMEAALAALPARRADVILCDLGLPGMGGIEGIALMRQRFPELVCLVLSVYEDDASIFRALCRGARGYLLKKTPDDRLLAGIRDAFDGGSPISPEIARRVVEMFRRFQPERSAPQELTPHEQRLLRLMVDGHTNRSAGQELGCTAHTVKFHLQNIYRKLEVHSKTEAVARALRDGLL